MSKTYRDMIRGRLRAAQKKFEADDKYHHHVWRRYYSYTRPDKDIGAVGLFDPAYRKVHWHKVRQVSPEYADKTPWDLLSYKEELYIFRGYSKNPSWWNRLYNTRPSRRNTRDLLRKYIGTQIIDAEVDHRFWLARKPNTYYW